MSSVRSQAFGIILAESYFPALEKRITKRSEITNAKDRMSFEHDILFYYTLFRKKICFKRLSFSSNSNFQ